jgi:hypothetical protein
VKTIFLSIANPNLQKGQEILTRRLEEEDILNLRKILPVKKSV